MENYEKKYKEALERAKNMINDLRKGEDILAVSELETMFPELVESKDEKIRKALIRFHKSTIDVDGIKGEDIVAWLEKQGKKETDQREENLEELLAADDIYQMAMNDDMVQEAKTKAINALSELQIGKLLGLEKQGEQKVSYTTLVETGNGGINALVTKELPTNGCDDEQKPTDNIEPKFQNGQWIVWQNKCYKVNYNGCGYELIDQNGLSTSLEYGTVDKSAHLLTIKNDAKDGDVLHSPSHRLIWIYKDNEHYHAAINLNYADVVSFDNEIVVPSDVWPADRVQKSILFQKMHEAGYEWSEETHELKKISQRTISVEANLYDKPAEWSEEDEVRLQACLDTLQAKSLMGKVDTVMTEWLKSLKERVQPIHEYSDTEKQEIFIKSQRPHFWRPSDEQMHAFEQVYDWYNNNYIPSETFTSLYNDLKKLREK